MSPIGLNNRRTLNQSTHASVASRAAAGGQVRDELRDTTLAPIAQVVSAGRQQNRQVELVISGDIIGRH